MKNKYKHPVKVSKPNFYVHLGAETFYGIKEVSCTDYLHIDHKQVELVNQGGVKLKTIEDLVRHILNMPGISGISEDHIVDLLDNSELLNNLPDWKEKRTILFCTESNKSYYNAIHWDNKKHKKIMVNPSDSCAGVYLAVIFAVI